MLTALLLTSGLAATQPLSFRDLVDPNAAAPLHDADLVKPAPPEESEPRYRPAKIDVDHYDLNISVDPVGGTIAGTAKLDFRAAMPNVDTIELDAYDMQIESVAGPRNEGLTYVNDGQLLTIALPRALASGERATVTVRYKTALPAGLRVTGPDATDPGRMPAAYTYTEPEGAQTWFPCFDRPSDKATATVQVVVPEGFNVLSNGSLEQDVPVGNRHLWRYRMEQPIATYLMSLAVGKYDVVTLGNFKGKPVTLWAPPAIRGAAVTTTLKTPQMMDVYSRFTGMDYPFASYAQSVAQAWKTSMEHQTATTMGGWRITGDQSGEGVVAHELAHQWFGDWVTCRTWGELWLNEGFATYLPYVYFATIGDEPRALGNLDSWRAAYFGQAQPNVHPLSWPDVDVDAVFDSHSYEKGGLVLHLMRHVADQLPALRGGTAEETFTLALRQYLQARGTGNATSYDLQAALERVTGTSWQTFFDQFVRSPGHPVLAVTPEYKDGRLVVSVEQKQATRTERRWRTFAFPLDVRILRADGTFETQTLQVYDDLQTFSISLERAPLAVAVDPEWVVPAELTVTQPEAAWLALLKASPEAAVRITAVRNLVALGSGKLSDEAFAAVAKDPSNYLLMDALSLLSSSSANLAQVAQLADELRVRADADDTTTGAVARADEWLVRARGSVPSRDDEHVWQEHFLASHVVAERKALLGMLDAASHERAQAFALERIKESSWVTQDRAYLIDELTKAPTAVSAPFIEEAVGNASVLWRNQILNNLIAASYDDARIVDELLATANGFRSYGTRALAIDLLAKQRASKETVCPALAALVTAGGTLRPETLAGVRAAAARAQAALECAR